MNVQADAPPLRDAEYGVQLSRLVAVEAQACGTPVIAYGRCGSTVTMPM